MMKLRGRGLSVGVSAAVLGLFVACGQDDRGDDGDGDGDGEGDGDGDPGSGGGDPASGGNTPASGGRSGTGGKGTGGDDENMGGGGMGGGGAGNTCDEQVEFPTELGITPRDDTNSWGENDFDAATIAQGDCGELLVTATWPHEDGWEGGDPAEANEESTKFEVQGPFAAHQDLTGKELRLTIKLLEDGRGPAAENGGYTVYLGAVEGEAGGWTQVATPWDGAHDNQQGNSNFPGYAGSLFNPEDEVTLSLVIPSDDANFDPTDVYKLSVRIESKIWGDGSGGESNPVFDYTESVFEISDLSIVDAE